MLTRTPAFDCQVLQDKCQEAKVVPDHWRVPARPPHIVSRTVHVQKVEMVVSDDEAKDVAILLAFERAGFHAALVHLTQLHDELALAKKLFRALEEHGLAHCVWKIEAQSMKKHHNVWLVRCM